MLLKFDVIDKISEDKLIELKQRLKEIGLTVCYLAVGTPHQLCRISTFVYDHLNLKILRLSYKNLTWPHHFFVTTSPISSCIIASPITNTLACHQTIMPCYLTIDSLFFCLIAMHLRHDVALPLQAEIWIITWCRVTFEVVKKLWTQFKIYWLVSCLLCGFEIRMFCPKITVYFLNNEVQVCI